MTEFQPSRDLEAALFANAVYHSKNEVFVPPPGWVLVAKSYDIDTGYSGEAWGRLNTDAAGSPIPGSYAEVFQVNRGTVFTEPGPDVPGEYSNDFNKTVEADAVIIFGGQPDYMNSATAFYNELNALLPVSVPITEVGQSLGGATSAAVTVYAFEHNDNGRNVSAITFNALAYGLRQSGAPDDFPESLVKNYYVGNELLTENWILRAFQWAVGGSQIGDPIYLPDYNAEGLDFLSPIEIHDQPAAIAQLFRSLYGDPPSAEAVAWLRERFPDSQQVPKQIAPLLGYPVDPTPAPEPVLPNAIALSNGDQLLSTPDRLQLIAYDGSSTRSLWSEGLITVEQSGADPYMATIFNGGELRSREDSQEFFGRDGEHSLVQFLDDGSVRVTDYLRGTVTDIDGTTFDPDQHIPGYSDTWGAPSAIGTTASLTDWNTGTAHVEIMVDSRHGFAYVGNQRTASIAYETTTADGSSGTVYIYLNPATGAATGATTTLYSDGSRQVMNPDGTGVIISASGGKASEVVVSGGVETRYLVGPYGEHTGEEVSYHPDGTVTAWRNDPSGGQYGETTVNGVTFCSYANGEQAFVVGGVETRFNPMTKDPSNVPGYAQFTGESLGTTPDDVSDGGANSGGSWQNWDWADNGVGADIGLNFDFDAIDYSLYGEGADGFNFSFLDGIGAPACFASGTPVLMADGSAKGIEAVIPGDLVMAFDGLGELVPARVARTFVHDDQEVMDVAGTRVTAGHRFLLGSGDWRSALALAANDELVAADGSVVSFADARPVAGRHQVHNIEVEAYHTYVAGNLRVHNMKAAPVALDLDGDNVVELVGLEESTAFFDIDADGFRERIGWVGPQDGLLALDIDGDGRITRADEIDFTRSAPGASTDMEGLRLAFDSNHDGKLDAADTRFADFRVWQDADQDGVADQGEVKTLAEMNIASIDLITTPGGNGTNGATVHGTANFHRLDGTSGLAADAAFAYEGAGVRIDEVRPDITLVTDEDGTRRAVVNDGARASLDLGAEAVSGARGGAGTDLFYTTGTQAIRADGAAGNDALVGGEVGDWLTGGSGVDQLSGQGGADTLSGGEGRDRILGGAGDDLVYGDDEFMDAGGGGDVVEGGAGDDTLYGEAMRFAGAASGDTLRGGAGADTLIGDAALLSGHGGNDTLQGGDGDDRLLGDALVMSGIGGDDILDGGAGDDVLVGDAQACGQIATATGSGGGVDTLTGGTGNDTLIGGGGRDVAVFSGNREDYEVVTGANGWTVVRDLRNDELTDGRDKVTGVEILRFADRDEELFGNAAPVTGEPRRIATVRGATKIGPDQLLYGVTDSDGDSLQVVAVAAGAGGLVRLSDGEVEFTPDAGFIGRASFTYTVSDLRGGQTTVTAYVDVKQATPTDPYFASEWHLDAMNVVETWDEYTGEGVLVGNVDGVVEYTHPDLETNYDTSRDGDFYSGDGDPYAPGSSTEGHATGTAGLIAAARNGVGVVGVAYDATLVELSMRNESGYQTNASWSSALAAARNVDVANIITQYSQPLGNTVSSYPWLDGTLQANAVSGRAGLGTVMTTTGGNQYLDANNRYGYFGGNSVNADDFTNSRYVIAVGALDSNGTASYATSGSSLLVTAPGSRLWTTDRTGATGYDTGDYSGFGGTCGASSVAAGVAALIIQANHNLGYRDVQEILAYSAVQTDLGNVSGQWSFNAAHDWNGGGLHVNDRYGYGMIDARAAVRLAETWTRQSTAANEVKVYGSSSPGRAILDSGTITDSLTVSSNLSIDYVEVDLNIDHQNLGDLIVTLVSPDGSESVLLNRLGKDPLTEDDTGVGSTSLRLGTSTSHHFGETGNGAWTLKVTDAHGGATGTLNNWTLRLYGDTRTSDDTYVYTDEFTRLAKDDVSRATLSDSAGIDTLNAAAVTGDTKIDLGVGGDIIVGGVTIEHSAGTVIENAFTGDGDDALAGNELGNILRAGRGDDRVEGRGGADTLDGGRGYDTAVYRQSQAGVSVDLATGQGHGGDAEGDVLMGFENLEGSAYGDVLAGSGDDNTLIGGDGGDTLLGGGGQDVLVGGLGDDVLDGGAGEDEAVFAHDFAEYAITRQADGSFRVEGREGVDIVSGVERIRFADRAFRTEANAPVAIVDRIAGIPGAPVLITRQALLANDFEFEGQPLTLVGVGGATGGTVTIDQTGNIIFTPLAGVPAGTFSYTVTDGDGAASSATVTVEFGPNSVPVVKSGVIVDADLTTPVTGQLYGVDAETPRERLQFALVQGVAHGQVTVSADGIFTYVPDPDYSGGDSFSYSVTDEGGKTAIASMSVQGATRKIIGPARLEDGPGTVQDTVSLVAGLVGGGFVVEGFHWQGSKAYSYLQLFSGAGEPVGEWIPRTYGTNATVVPKQIIATPDGGFAILGERYTKQWLRIAAFDRYDASGNYIATQDIYGGFRDYFEADDTRGVRAVAKGDGTFDLYWSGFTYDYVSESWVESRKTLQLDAQLAVVGSPINEEKRVFNLSGGARLEVGFADFAWGKRNYLVRDPAGDVLYTGECTDARPLDDGGAILWFDGTATAKVQRFSSSGALEFSQDFDDIVVMPDGRIAGLLEDRGDWLSSTNPQISIYMFSSSGALESVKDYGTLKVKLDGYLQLTHLGGDSFAIAGSAMYIDDHFDRDIFTAVLSYENQFSGSEGPDHLYGSDAQDTLIGGGGDDIVSGKAGDDVLEGGAGDDTLSGGLGSDVVDGGDGADVAIFDGARATYAVTRDDQGGVTLSAGGSIDRIAGVEILRFTDGDMLLQQSAPHGAEGTYRYWLNGGDGGDVLGGSSGADTLSGGAGNDTFITGGGSDVIDGGVGEDVARFSGTLSSSRVTIIRRGEAIVEGADGVDHVFQTEVLRFDDGDVRIDANHAPVAQDRPLSTVLNTPLTMAVGDLLAGATDVDGDVISLAWAGNATGGTVAVADGRVVFTPETNFRGYAGFDYTVSDGMGGTDTKHASVAVYPASDILTSGAISTQAAGMSITHLAGAVLGDGRQVMAWASLQSGAVQIFARVLVDGIPTGAAFRVNTDTSARCDYPTVCALADGGFLVGWQSGVMDFNYRLQRYDSAGQAVGEQFALSPAVHYGEGAPSFVALPDGGFVAVWDATLSGVRAQHFDAHNNLIGGEIAVSSPGAFKSAPKVALLGNGDLLFTWEEHVSGDVEIFARRFSSAGEPLSPEFQLNLATTNYQWKPAVAALNSGGFIATWESWNQDGSFAGVFARRYDAEGNAIGSEFQVNTTTYLAQETPTVIAMADGGFFIAWFDSSKGVCGQRFAANGGRIGGEIRIGQENSSLDFDDEVVPVLLAGANDFITVAWSKSYSSDISLRVLERSKHAPTAQDKSAVTQEDMPLILDEGALLSRAMDVDGDPLDLSAVGNATGGTVALNGSGNVVFTPDADFNGDGGFDYTVSDGLGGFDTGHVSVRVEAVDDPITVLDGTVATVIERSAFGSMDVLDPDGGALSFSLLNGTANGTVELNVDGTYRYIPAPGFSGIDSFTVRVTDSTGNSDTSVVTVKVGATRTSVDRNERQVNTYTLGDQYMPLMTPLSGGGFVMTWSSNLQDGSSFGIYGQRYDVAGQPVGGEFRVNTYTADAQLYTSAAALSDGGFVVTWESYGQDGSSYGVYGQRYDAFGQAAGGEFRVNTYASGNQGPPAVVALSGGGFVVAWQSYGQDGSGYGIHGQRYDAAGQTVAGEFRINTSTNGDQTGTKLIALSDGGFLATWLTYGQDGSDYGVYAQRYASSGQAVGGEFRINTYTDGNQMGMKVISLSDGGLVAVWISFGQDGSLGGIYGQRYDSAGNAVGGEFRINTYTNDTQTGLQVKVLAGGGFVVTWTSNGQDGSGYGVYGQRYDASGQAVGGEFRINTWTADAQQYSSVTALPDGGFVAVWQSNLQDGSGGGIFGQCYDASGQAAGSEFQVNIAVANDQTAPQVIALADGSMAVAWTSTSQDGDGNGVYLRVLGGSGADGWLGGSGDDVIIGDAWSERIQGLAGNDTIAGGLGDDVVEGGNGRDVAVFQGNQANSSISQGALGEVVVDGIDGHDVLSGIEVLRFSDGDIRLTNDAPILGADVLSTIEDKAMVVATMDLLANDLDVDGDTLSVSVVGNAVGGAVALDGAGNVVFTPTADFHGTASFDYMVADGYGATGTGTVTVDVVAVNDAPVAQVKTAATLEDSAVTILAVDLLAGTTDVDGDTLRLSAVGNAVGGSVALSGAGNAVFTPDANFHGTATFTYTVADGQGGTSTQTVTVNVAAVNDAPVAQAKAAATSEDTAVTVLVADLLAGATDVDGDALVLSSVGNAVGGSVALDGAGNVVFTPNANFFGQASFAYTVADGQGGFSTRTVTVDVAAVNDAPVAQAKTAATSEDTAVTILVSDLLAGASDVEGDTLTLSSVGNAVGGSVALDGAGNLVFTPTANSNGTAGFDYTIADGQGGFATRHVTVQVSATYDPVIALDGVTATVVGQAASGAVPVANPDGGALSYSLLSGTANGTLALNANGSYSYTPAAGFSGTDSFSYRVTDGTGSFDDGVVTVTVGAKRTSSDSGESRANTYTLGDQTGSKMARLADGGFVVTWLSNGQDGSGNGVYGQRYDAGGQAVGSEFRVNTCTTHDQFSQQVTSLSGGGFVVTWQSYLQDGNGYGVYGQRYNAGGQAVGGEFRVNTYTTNHQYVPQVTALSDGGFVVTWQSYLQDGSGNGVYGQHYNASGQAMGGVFRVNTYTTNNQNGQQVTALSDGGFVVTWLSYLQDGSGDGVYGQRYDAGGQTVGSEFRVNTYTVGAQYNQQVTALANGGFVVTWSSNMQDGSGYGVYGQRYNAAGQAVGGEFRVNTYTTSTQYTPQVTALLEGGFVVTWSSNMQDGNGWGVYGQRYDASGQAVGGEFRVNTCTTYDQFSQQVMALSDGGFVVTWSSDMQDGSGCGVYGQRYNASGQAVGGEFRVNASTANNQMYPQLIALDGGAFAISWRSDLQDGSGYGTYVRVFGADGWQGGSGDDIITGDSRAELIQGCAGADTLDGGAGDDTLAGGAGADSLIGGAGTDTASYAASAVGVTVSLATGTGMGSDAQGDVLSGIEVVVGSAYADALTGSSGNDRLDGGSGDDTLAGGAGVDSLIGGAGTDTASYAASAVRVFVSLATGTGMGGDAQGDVLSGIETVVGSAYADALIGSSGDDRLDGGSGDDTLAGGAGVDSLIGGAGTDTASYAASAVGVAVSLATGTGMGGDAQGDVLSGIETVVGTAYADALTGSSGNDRLDGGSGDDTLAGGGGADSLIGGAGTDTASYAASVVGVTVSLATGTGTGGDAQGDVLSGVEAVAGSAYVDTLTGSSGSDRLDGGSGADRLDGGSGADTLVGGAGADSLIGGAGTDTASYVASAAGVTVSLATGTGMGGDAQGDVLSGIETVVGSACADTLTGSSGNDTLVGGAGDDVLTGGSGTDVATFVGSRLAYAVTCGAFGEAVIDGSDGHDSVSGVEVLRFADGDIRLDTLMAVEDVPVTISSTDLLAAGYDTVVSASNAIGGSVALDGVGNLVFTPTANFNGTAGFDYTIADGQGRTVTQHVVVQVSATYDPVIALDGVTATVVGQAASGAVPVANPDGGALSYSLLSGTANGTLALNANGSYSYTPAAGFSGTDSFSYRVTDGTGNFNDGVVTVTVGAKRTSSDSGETRANTYTSGDQTGSKMAPLADGGFVVTWLSNGQDGGGNGVYGQRYDAGGQTVGGEFRVNTYTVGAQYDQQVTSLSDGGFVVTWVSNGQDGSGNGVYGQRYDAGGQTVGGEFRVNTYTTNSQYVPQVTSLAGGGFVVTWQSYLQDGSGDGVYGQRYDADGQTVGGEFRVNAYTTNTQYVSQVTSLAGGGFVVTWVSCLQDGSGEGVYGQRYDASGQAVGGEFRVNTYTADRQFNQQVTALANGGFVVMWQSNLQNGSSNGVYGQRYDASGQAVGGEFRVNTYTTNSEYTPPPQVTALSDGGFVVTWQSYLQDGDGYGVYGQRYNASGLVVGSEFRINTYTANNQCSQQVMALSDGGFVVTWLSNMQDGSSYGIYGQRYNASGQAVGGEFRVNASTANTQVYPQLIALDGGAFAISWQSDLQDGSGYGTYVRVMEGTNGWQGGSGDDIITGDSRAELIQGHAGADTIDGGAGNDSLVGGAGADTYVFGRGGGSDVVDNRGQETDGDRISFATGVAMDQLWFRHMNNDLEVSIIGTTDTITVTGWYLTSSNHVSSFVTTDGKTMIENSIENLVSAMAAMTSPPVGQTQLSSEQHLQLDSVLAANWQSH